MTNSFKCDAAIIGGGIAGLFILDRLKSEGYNAILLEKNSIGYGQTLASQGMIHSGIKYRLDGSDPEISKQLVEVSQRWTDFFSGSVQPDLSSSTVHSTKQYLWTKNVLLDKLALKVVPMFMNKGAHKLPEAEQPPAFKLCGYNNDVYEISETVMDVKSVCNYFFQKHFSSIYWGTADDFQLNSNGSIRSIQTDNITIEAGAFFISSGSANETFGKTLKLLNIAQRRPLRQFMIRGKLPLLYGHCVTSQPKPLFSITSHPYKNETIWYLGGNVAEPLDGKGGYQTPTEIFKLLFQVFPFAKMMIDSWATYTIDRAEAKTADGRLPNEPTLMHHQNLALCWPTKLVYAPVLADHACNFMRKIASPSFQKTSQQLSLNKPKLGEYPWEKTEWQPFKQESY
ncbi:FAD-dependent oxidoreductase [bacterium]|nr:FAD-dependent oxidoreductase [bacterium]